MITLIRHDLEFILQQIKISEALTNNTLLDGTPFVPDPTSTLTAHEQLIITLIPDPHLPWGLRTVDGRDNNIVPGRSEIGAADTVFPRQLDPDFLPEYAGTGPAPVIDADPRIISNLIVDMSPTNPAAVSAWRFANGLDATVNPGDPGAPPFNEIPNIAPDTGISAPFNSWMTLFGQFFDHGLDLVTKGGPTTGVVLIPLAADDPLVLLGADGVADTGDEVAAGTFMAMTRATAFEGAGADGILLDDPTTTSVNEAADNTFHEAQNTTTSWIDQNQTYTSHASHQVFLREYVATANGPLATGRLLNSSTDGNSLPTWADVKDQARTVLGIDLQDADVVNLPLLRTDAYGEFIRGANGLPQIITDIGIDGIPNTSDDATVSGNLATPVNTFTVNALRTGHAFLDDIAHAANPIGDHDGNPFTARQLLTADGDSAVGLADGTGTAITGPGFYDDELLDRHFVTGDGRGNENIGLTAVHHVFHSEHNRIVTATQETVLATDDLAFINEWLLVDVTAVPTSPAGLVWDGERLFQAARFGTEMQYQHLVFEEFGRKIQPAIDLFVFNSSTDIDSSIVAEFAHTVYRFGHSMLTDTIARIDDAGVSNDIGLIEAFLNPIEFNQDGALTADQATAEIIRGMTRQVGNEIDEFVVDAVRSNLLGQPLDLAAINIARGRDTGVPSLNDARAQLFAATSSTFLKPYDSWFEFAQGLKNTSSVVNFIAAYGTHELILAADTLQERRDAANLLIFGGAGAPDDRIEFLTSTGRWANNDTTHPTVDRDGVTRTGLGNIDLWIGGLAEAIMPFGGMLGSTFNAIFELQMENLQNGDRFYYLTRTQGLNFINELENNSFANMVMANTSLGDGTGIASGGHLPGDLFQTVDHILELNTAVQIGPDPTWPEGTDPFRAAIIDYVERDNPNTPTTDGPDTNYLEYNGAGHVVLGGTNNNDILIASEGDDTIWGDGGNDRIEGGAGVDRLHGGAGDDIITDSGDADFIHGEDGNDVISGGNGLDLLFGGDGSDFMVGGVDATEVFGDRGDDFILGGNGSDFLAGNEGNDWIEGAGGFDTIAGDNSELFFDSTIIGHDVMFAGADEQDFDAESGDDIMVQGESIIRSEGMLGFDWGIFLGSSIAANADLRARVLTTDAAGIELDILRNRFDRVEALSGSDLNDRLVGDSRVEPVFDPLEPDIILPENAFSGDELLRENVSLINGFSDFLGGVWTAAQLPGNINNPVIYSSGNILIGGGGSDIMQGNGGNDIIDGDAWLNVRISIVDSNGNEVRTVNSLTEIQSELLAGVYNPSQLRIVREMMDVAGAPANSDVAVFRGSADEYLIEGTDTGGAPDDANGDGFISVFHRGVSDGAGGFVAPLRATDDGTDLLRNVERLRFLNNGSGPASEFSIANSPATGRPTLSRLNVTTGPFILAAGTLADQDGIGTISFFWQVFNETTETWDLLANGNSLTEAQVPVDGQVRGVATWVDGGGATETVTTIELVVIDTDGNAVIRGGGGSLILTGTPEIDTLSGGAGDDVITGLGSADELFGEGGDDTIFADSTDTTVDGGEGQDVVVLESPAGNTRFIAMSGVEVLHGSAGDDLVTVANATTGIQMYGYGGNDQLYGSSFNDVIDAGEGDDIIDGGLGADSMSGGAGNDTYFVDSLDDKVTESNGEGTQDRVNVTVTNYTLTANVEIGAVASTTGLTLTGNSGANLLLGNVGNDTLMGADGNDTVNGNEGDDDVQGGKGNDVLAGAAGRDMVNGGEGNDTVVWDAADDLDNVLGGADRDTLLVVEQDAPVTFDLAAHEFEAAQVSRSDITGTQFWSNITNNYTATWTLSSQRGEFDGGSSWVMTNELTGTQAHDYTLNYYNADNAQTGAYVHQRDGTSYGFVFDVDNETVDDESWSYYINYLDNQNRQEGIFFQNDDGSSRGTSFDAGDRFDWDTISQLVDSSGRTTTVRTVNDDRSVVSTRYDASNGGTAQEWSSITDYVTPENQVSLEVTNYDNGDRLDVHFDLTNQLPTWDYEAFRYNFNGQQIDHYFGNI
ncbi:MAG: peroxidase family protein [Hyphomicrobiaceae bacterium]